jgi:hypothetical protein
MIFKIRLPSSSPKLSIMAMHSTMTSTDGICEASIDLSILFAEIHRKKIQKKLSKAKIKLSIKNKIKL